MLNKQYRPKSLRNLELLTFVDSTLYINKLYNAVFSAEQKGEEKKTDKKKKTSIEVIKDSQGNTEEFIAPKIPSPKAEKHPSDGLSIEEMYKELFTTPWNKDVVISIATRIGVGKTQT